MSELDSQKAIYMGIPICIHALSDGGAQGVGPMAALLFRLFELGLPFNGEFFIYEGSYLVALWHWVFDDDGDMGE